MRQIRFLTTCLLMTVLVACEETLTETPSSHTGKLEIFLDAEDTHKPMMKSGDDAVPDVGDFTIEFFTPDGMRFYRKSYSETVGETIVLNAAEGYRMLAYYGSPKKVGFDAIYYEAEEMFDIARDETKGIKATAKMANVKVAVNFGDDLLRDYKDVCCQAYTSGSKDRLSFDPDVAAAGYTPAGGIVLELYVTDDGTRKFYRFDPVDCEGNDFITFNVNTSPLDSKMQVSIEIDDSVETVNLEQKVPQSALPPETPQIFPRGKVGQDGVYSFADCEVNKGSQIDFLVMGGIKSVKLDFGQDNVLGLEDPVVDLVAIADDNGQNNAVAGKLEEYGIDWVRDMKDARIGFIDLSMMGEHYHFKSRNSLMEIPFTLTIEDNHDNVSEPKNFVLRQVPVNFVLNAGEGNAFARRISGVTIDMVAGSTDHVSLEYSADNGNTWTDVPGISSTDNSVAYPDITGLTKETQYQLRALYHGQPVENIGPVTLTTEQELQVGNAGFEEWKEWEYYVNKEGLLWGADVYQTNYAPFQDNLEKWWDSNNSETTPGNRTNTSATYKSFPMVTYVAGRSGEGKAAQIMTIAISNTATSATCPEPRTVAAGKLFIGNYGGNQGHAFGSRPAKFIFHYKYQSHKSENFRVYAYLKNGEEIIAQGTATPGASSDWTQFSVDFEYSTIAKVADSIYIEFVSSSSPDNPAWTASSMSITYGNNKTAGVFGGSILTVDDIQLIYE